MRWGHDDLVDKLIANNAARPRPGMEKPDVTRLALTGRAGEKQPPDGPEVEQKQAGVPVTTS